MFRNLFPIPNETLGLSAPISLKNDIISTINYVSAVRNNQYAGNITLVSNPPWLHGLSGYSDSSAPGTGLQNIHFHPELILQPFLHRRRYKQWLLTDDGTFPHCYSRSADSCSNFSEIYHSHYVSSAV